MANLLLLNSKMFSTKFVLLIHSFECLHIFMATYVKGYKTSFPICVLKMIWCLFFHINDKRRRVLSYDHCQAILKMDLSRYKVLLALTEIFEKYESVSSSNQTKNG